MYGKVESYGFGSGMTEGGYGCFFVLKRWRNSGDFSHEVPRSVEVPEVFFSMVKVHSSRMKSREV